jgi:hypothetical protein
MSSGLVVGFSPNDFFFVKAQQSGTMPDADRCSSLSTNIPQNCDVSPTQDCLNYELCKNQDNANTLYNIQNQYGGSDQKYDDGKFMYNEELFNTFNLGAGIVIAIGFIYTKYIYKQKI